MGHEIGKELEDHAEGVALAKRYIEQAHQPFGQQHKKADGQRRQQWHGNLAQDVSVYGGEQFRPSSPCLPGFTESVYQG